MKKGITAILIFFVISTNAQHCPWDCSGFLMVKTDANPIEIKKLNPVLVDLKKNIVVDTMYGTGRETFDTCRFLLYSDYKKAMTEKIKIHHWYQYDTMFNFARGFYVVHYSYCKYNYDGPTQLFIRYNDLKNPGSYKYIEIPKTKRIHLHEYANQLWDHDDKGILTEVQPMVIDIKKEEW